MKIVHFPNKILQVVCQPYKFGKNDDKMRRKVLEMYKLMRQARGLGLSACQVEWPVRIFVMNTDKVNQTFVNPELTWVADEVCDFDEGCLSYPDDIRKISRPASVRIKYQDTTGFPQEKEFTGLEARVILHEMDHLNGITFESR